MFGRMMNNYYYGKSGKGDFRKDDMPETRMQLFWDTLRTRLAGLFRLNLLYMLVWLPAMIVILVNAGNLWDRLQMQTAIMTYDYSEYVEEAQSKQIEVTISEEDYIATRNTLLVLQDANYDAYLERIGDQSENTLTQEQFQYLRNNSATGVQNSILTLLMWLIVTTRQDCSFTLSFFRASRCAAGSSFCFSFSSRHAMFSRISSTADRSSTRLRSMLRISSLSFMLLPPSRD